MKLHPAITKTLKVNRDKGKPRSDLALHVAISSPASEINQEHIDGKTPLIRLCSCGLYNEARVLLCKSADPNLQDNSSWTALAWAAYRDHPKTTALLLCFGADPKIESKDGKTALDNASSRCYELIRLWV